MTENEQYQAARLRVRKQKDFWVHLVVYVAVNIGLATLNLLTEPGKLWFHWVVMGWGAGILLHAFQVFGNGAACKWEEKKIQQILAQEAAKDALRSKTSI